MVFSPRLRSGQSLTHINKPLKRLEYIFLHISDPGLKSGVNKNP